MVSSGGINAFAAETTPKITAYGNSVAKVSGKTVNIKVPVKARNIKVQL